MPKNCGSNVNHTDVLWMRSLKIKDQKQGRGLDLFALQKKNEAFSKNNGDKTTNYIPSQKADHVGSSQNKKSYASSFNGDRYSKVEKQVTTVKGNTLSNVSLTPFLITPSLVLDDSCIGKKLRETMDIEENLVLSFDRKQLCIKTKQADNILEKFKVIFKGNVYMARAKELFAWTPIFLDHKEFEYISNDESLHGAKNNSEKVVEQQSVYDVLNKKPKGVAQDADSSLSHPPGFTPKVSRQENDHRRVDLNTETDKVNSPLVHTKTKNEWVKELNIKHKVNFLALQETKMDRVNHMDVKFIWGNSNYQYVSSDSAGSSGEILCVWEATIFKKDYATISDNFIAIYGTWISKNSKVLIVVIYAPQSLSHKRVLWDYISSLIARWNRETIVMGDFNEVRSIDERFGVMVGDSMSRKLAWADTVQKLRSRLSKWKIKTLSIGEVRTILDDIFLPSAADATRWVKYIPIKIIVFAWRARLDRLPTIDLSLWDLDWHDLLSFSNWNAWFSAIRLPFRIKLILEGVFYVAWWHLWVYRNQSIFAATPPRRSVIFDDIVSRPFTWCASSCNSSFS
nr:RNA-directed DNA polymerase, eukaryota [Tanacetum cinerariifolium]